MSDTTEHVVTAEQLVALSDEGKRYELIDGILHEMFPAGARQGELAAKLLFLIMNQAERLRSSVPGLFARHRRTERSPAGLSV